MGKAKANSFIRIFSRVQGEFLWGECMREADSNAGARVLWRGLPHADMLSLLEL